MMPNSLPAGRYKEVAKEKADGATFTPKLLSDFVAQNIAIVARNLISSKKKDSIIRSSCWRGRTPFVINQ